MADPRFTVQPGSARASATNYGFPVGMQPAPDQLSSYEPSWRDKLSALIAGGVEGATGMSRGYSQGVGDRITQVADFLPGAGSALAVDDTKRSLEAGDYGGAAMNAMGFIPIPGAKAVGKAGSELLGSAGGRDALASIARIGHNMPPSAATVGDIANPGVMFEGVSPHEFTPDQWGRFGEAHGVPNLGPMDAGEWEKSLVPYTSSSGRQFTVPGGAESKDPLTYYDLLHLKQQGINPNEIPPELHQGIHDRMVRTMSPEGDISPERMFNQLSLAQISPNQPLTPNELAVARVMAKGPEDLQRMGEMIPWRYDDAAPDKELRKFYNDKIANDLGLGAGKVGGLGARGTADYTRLAETAQRMQADPDFFKFRGEGEMGGGDVNSAENWANFVERLSNQTPGLSSKTGSFGAVWQNPAEANISAVDRHMAGLFTKEMFPSTAEYDDFARGAVDKYNASGPVKQVSDFSQLPQAVKNDAMFGYLNNNPSMKYRTAGGEINPRVPEHLQPGNADWIEEPGKIDLISDPYKRVLAANAERANEAGQSTFANQWMLWDRVRNRLEPHEVMFPGLEKLPRMSMDQMRVTRDDLAKAGYMSSSKDIDPLTDQKKLAPVRPLPSASRAAYFTAPPLAAGAMGYSIFNRPPGQEENENGL